MIGLDGISEPLDYQSTAGQCYYVWKKLDDVHARDLELRPPVPMLVVHAREETKNSSSISGSTRQCMQRRETSSERDK